MKPAGFASAAFMLVFSALSANALETAYQDHHDTLASAVADRHIPEVRRLLEEGADPYAVTRIEYKGNPAQAPVFAAAILSKDHAVLEAFLKAGVSPTKPLTVVVNGKSCTLPPVLVAVNHRIRAVAELVQYGATLNIPATACHETPLIEAVYAGNTMMVEFLLNRGVRINERGWNEKSALHAAVAASTPFEWNDQLTAQIIEAGGEVDATNRQGETPLHWAAEHSCRKCLDLLLEHGADALKADARGRTARAIAARGRSEAINAILQREEVRLRALQRKEAQRNAAEAARQRAREAAEADETVPPPEPVVDSEDGAAADGAL